MYFLTTKNLGNNPVIKPKFADDGYKPSICVAPTIEQCLFGIAELYHTRRYYKGNDTRYYKRVKPFRIYFTDARGVPARKIFDFKITKEHHLYKPTQFHFVGLVDENLVKVVYKKIRAYYKEKGIL